MYVNSRQIVGVLPLTPNGTNSTMFTECCEVAICDDEKCCPRCKRKVIGHDAPSAHERGVIRWKTATSRWRNPINEKRNNNS